MATDSLSACVAEIKGNPGRFYVYILRRPSGVPFYVGCGRGARIKRHDAEARTPARSRKLNIMRKVGLHLVRYEIESWWASWSEAARREREMIALFGRLDLNTGTLANLTDGGDGTSGVSDATRKLKAAATKNRWRDPLYRSKMSQQSRALWSDLSVRDAMAEKVRRSRTARDLNSAHAERIRAKWKDRDYRARQAAAAATHPSLQRDHLLAMLVKRWADPARRAQHAAAMRAKHADPEFKRRHREATKLGRSK